MTQNKMKIIMVGAYPPPVHGMAVVNATVRNALLQLGIKPRVVSVAAPSLDRSLAVRICRMPRVLRGLVYLLVARLNGGTLYMSVSGGLGQVYELCFVVLARLHGMRIFMHHHNFSYLDRPNWLTKLLIFISGTDAVHVTQSPRMARLLEELYGVKRAIPISNAVFLVNCRESLDEPRQQLRTLGFISNIATEKGIFEFLDLISSAQDAGLQLSAKIAGPFQDTRTEQLVRAKLLPLHNVDVVGPKYGAEKEAFYADIDVLVFPTLYANETEGIVNLEAMSHGIPVIAYGRGCIPEIVDAECGKVIDPAKPFVPMALKQIVNWLEDPAVFEAASNKSAQRFAEIFAQNEQRWKDLLNELTGNIELSLQPSISKMQRSSAKT